MDTLKALIFMIVLGLFAGFVLLFLTVSVKADEKTIVNFDDLYSNELASKSFEVNSPGTISIEAIGAGRRSSDNLYAYGWILNNNTRKPEWVMDYDNTDRYERSSVLRWYEGELDLKEGSYTAFFYVGSKYSISLDGFEGVVTIIKDAFSSDDEYTEDFEMVIKSKSGSFSSDYSLEPPSGNVVQLLADDDDFYDSKGFTLERELKLHVYAVGEYSKSDKIMVDGAWIIDAETRENVWMMERWNTEPAGGATKNRQSDETITLPAGNYIAFYSTDGSHSPESWNMCPPYDPFAWGVNISVNNPSHASFVKPYEDTHSSREILSITRVGDDEFECKYFTVKKPVKVHVYAIGEYDRYGDEFADYGWIEDLNSLERVFEMDWRNTDHAGGSTKNRKFSGSVELNPGDYSVCYVSDGSHSYRDWNASPPSDQRQYGISIYGLGSDFDMSTIERHDDLPSLSENVLVSISAVRDDEEVSEEFTLSKPTKIHIYAIGEGSRDEMYDYAWIENARTGRVEWEMRYRKTRHAGGAKKNRVFDDTIELDAGTYEVFYLTDDSHAFGSWNSDKPDDEIHWGITITIPE